MQILSQKLEKLVIYYIHWAFGQDQQKIIIFKHAQKMKKRNCQIQQGLNDQLV